LLVLLPSSMVTFGVDNLLFIYGLPVLQGTMRLPSGYEEVHGAFLALGPFAGQLLTLVWIPLLHYTIFSRSLSYWCTWRGGCGREDEHTGEEEGEDEKEEEQQEVRKRGERDGKQGHRSLSHVNARYYYRRSRTKSSGISSQGRHCSRTESAPSTYHGSYRINERSSPSSSTSSDVSPRSTSLSTAPMNPLTKIYLGMITIVLCLISSLILCCVREMMPLVQASAGIWEDRTYGTKSAHDLSIFWMLIPFTLRSLANALVWLGSLQFIFESSPAFLRCSVMGVLLSLEGTGELWACLLLFLVGVGVGAVMQVQNPEWEGMDHLDDALMLKTIFVTLLVIMVTFIITFYFVMNWYARELQKEELEAEEERKLEMWRRRKRKRGRRMSEEEWAEKRSSHNEDGEVFVRCVHLHGDEGRRKERPVETHAAVATAHRYHRALP